MVTGRSRKGLVGQGLFEAFPNNPNDPNQVSEKTVRASLEYAAVHKEEHMLPVQRYDIAGENGTYEEHYWSASNKPVLDTNGKVIYLIHSIENVTTKIKSEKREARLKSIEKAYTLFMQAPAAVCIVKGPEYIVELANEKMLEFLGRTNAMLGKPIIESLPEAKLQGLISILDQVYQSGEPYHVTSFPASIIINGIRDLRYFDLVFKPYFDNLEDAVPTGIFCVAHNITKQIRYQKHMEESEHRFRTLIEEATVATGLYLGRELQIQYANEILLGYWGKSSTIIGLSLSEAVPELKGQPFLNHLDKVYTTGMPYTGVEEEAYLYVDGRWQLFYFNVTYKALRNKEGEIYGIHHMAIDVTAQVLAKKKIEAAEQKARLAIESAELGTYEVDLITDKMVTSDRCNAIWGMSTAEDRGDYLKFIHPDDVNIRNKANQEALEKGFIQYEVRLLTGKDRLKWVRVNGKVVYDQYNKPIHILGVVQDITAQKLFAEELAKQVRERTAEVVQAHKSLLETNQYFQFIINKFEAALAALVPIFEGPDIVDFSFKMTNTAYSAYSRLTPEQIQNKRVSEVFPNYYKTDAFDRFVEVYRTGVTQSWELNYNVDGLNVHLQVVASKMNGEVIANFTDFTTLKNLQLDLLRKIEELERSNKNLEEFAYAASHDLKEPIRKIHLFGERLKESLGQRLTEMESRYFERMELATNRMGTLIDDLLTYSEVNQKSILEETVDLNQLLGQVLSDLDLEIEQRNASIKIGELFTLKGHRRQLQQAFQNLISNALKYSKPGFEPVITISCSKVQGSQIDQYLTTFELTKDYYHISVQDNGIGFDPADAGRIFNVFTRLHGLAEYKGTGVGLSIVRKVISNHQGHIWAESTPGEGATFKIILPAG